MSESGRHFKPTLKYLKSKGLPLFLIALLPSVLMTFLISPSSMLYFLCNYFGIESFDFSTMYLKMFNFDSEFYYIGIIGVVLFIFIISIMYGTIDRHMRTGEFTISFGRAKSRINYNFLTAFKVVGVFVIIFELYNVVNILFALLWAGAMPTEVSAFVFTIITFVIFSFILLIVFSSMILWSPFMLHTGLSSFEAFKMAMRQNVGNIFKICGALIIVIVPFAILMILNGILGWGKIVRILLDSICLDTLVVLYLTLMYTVFYDVTGTERMDLQNMNIWSKKKGV